MPHKELSARLLAESSTDQPDPLASLSSTSSSVCNQGSTNSGQYFQMNPYDSLGPGGPASPDGRGHVGSSEGGDVREPAPWSWTVPGAIRYASDRLQTKEYVFLGFMIVGLPALAGAAHEWDSHSRELLMLVVTAMLMWLLAPFDIHSAWVSLLLLLLIPALGIASFEVAWQGGGSDATWIIFSGMVIAAALKKTPLGDRMAFVLIHYSPSVPRLIFNSCVLGLVLAIMVPSSIVRATVMVQAAKNVLEQLSLPTTEPSHISQALFLSLGLSTVNCGSGLLTATAPNLLMNEGITKQTGQNFSYAIFAGQMFLPFSLMQVFTIFFSVWFVFGRASNPDDYQERRAMALEAAKAESSHPSRPEQAGGRKLHMPPLSAVEIKTMCIVAAMIVFWITDVASNIRTVIIAIAGVVFLTFPRLGPLCMDDLRGLNFPTIIFVIGIIALGDVSAANPHLQDVVSRPLREFAASARSRFVKLWMTSLTASIVMWLFGSAASASLATSVFVKSEATLDLSPKDIGLCIAAAMNVFFLPYQSAPLLVAKESRLFTTSMFFFVVGLNAILVFFIVIPTSIALRSHFDND
eukprot:m.489385 g.489385  ORF g.489385 m.489385 type:complete len:579 (+) comp26699_c0_seq1:466-2202(+)